VQISISTTYHHLLCYIGLDIPNMYTKQLIIQPSTPFKSGNQGSDTTDHLTRVTAECVHLEMGIQGNFLTPLQCAQSRPSPHGAITAMPMPQDWIKTNLPDSSISWKHDMELTHFYIMGIATMNYHAPLVPHIFPGSLGIRHLHRVQLWNLSDGLDESGTSRIPVFMTHNSQTYFVEVESWATCHYKIPPFKLVATLIAAFRPMVLFLELT